MSRKDYHMTNRDFKGVWIPKEIWLNNELNLQEKALLVEIDSLDRQDGCYAHNKHFADFLGISKSSVSRYISQLVEKGYIDRKVTHKQKRILRSKLGTTVDGKDRLPYAELHRGVRKNAQGGTQKRKGGNSDSVDTKGENPSKNPSSSTKSSTKNNTYTYISLYKKAFPDGPKSMQIYLNLFHEYTGGKHGNVKLDTYEKAKAIFDKHYFKWDEDNFIDTLREYFEDDTRSGLPKLSYFVTVSDRFFL